MILNTEVRIVRHSVLLLLILYLIIIYYCVEKYKTIRDLASTKTQSYNKNLLLN